MLDGAYHVRCVLYALCREGVACLRTSRSGQICKMARVSGRGIHPLSSYRSGRPTTHAKTGLVTIYCRHGKRAQIFIAVEVIANSQDPTGADDATTTTAAV